MQELYFSAILPQVTCEELLKIQIKSVTVATVNPEETTLCNICYAQVPNSTLSRMNCSHKYCQGCVTDFLTHLINESKIEDESLACPECRTRLDFDIIMDLLNAQMIDRYHRFTIKAMADRIAKIGVVTECPNCQYAVFSDKQDLFEEIKEVTCSKCFHEFCPHCQMKHGVNLTCEQYKQWKEENDQADAKFQEIWKELKWAKCPHCNAYAEKISGCNFIYCSSKTCQSMKYFCYLCSATLTEADHHDHYLNTDPFNSPCINSATPGQEELVKKQHEIIAARLERNR